MSMPNTAMRMVKPSPTQTRSTSLILIGLIVAVSMSSIDQTIVSLSSQAIQSGLGLSSSAIEWVVNSYLLSAAALFPLAGRLSDALGYKRVMLVGVTVFGLGSLLCGITPAGNFALVWMVISRVIQGAGLAFMFPAAIGIVFTYSPENKRASSMATFFAITGAMTAVGPIAGSYLVTLSWRYIFCINLPLALAAIVLITFLVPGDTNRFLQKALVHTDWVGAALAAVAMITLIVPLQQANSVGWLDLRIIGSLVMSLLLFVVFIVFEQHQANPIVNIRVFTSYHFSLSAIASLVASIIFIPIMYFLSVYGQLSLGQNVLNTSLLILYFFIGFLVSSKIGALIFSRAGISRVLLFSGIITLLAFGFLAQRVGSLHTALPDGVSSLSGLLMMCGAGIGLMFSPAATDMVNRAIGSSYGEVTALSQLLKNFGGALGMAVFSSACSAFFSSNLLTGLGKYGVTASMANQLANSIGSSSSQTRSGTLSHAPAQVQEAILNTVKAAYAQSVGYVFIGMAGLGAIFILIAIIYPHIPSRRGEVVTES